MKVKQCFFSLLILVICTHTASARIWRVNILSNYNGSTLWGDNFGGNEANPVFTQLTDANGSALVQSGDTIHVEGSIDVYDGVTITKKLTILGAGNFLTDNPNVSNDLLESKINNVVFNTGSAGSQILGAHITSSYGIDIYNISNITVKRCRIEADISVGYSNSDIFVIGNYFPNASASTVSCIAISGYGFPVNFIFNNNISQRTVLLRANSTTVYSVVECKNNVFDCPALTGGNPSIEMLCNNFQNNILKTPGAVALINSGVAGSGVSYNISASNTGQFGAVNNNIIVSDQTTLFIASASADGKYQLKTSSPGSGNGSDNTDRGAFGGASITNHYTLSGLAPIPVIYDISTSGVSDISGLPVTIKARTIK